MWGACLGFEMLHIIISGLKKEDMLVSCDAENYSIPLEFTAGKKRRLRDQPIVAKIWHRKSN